VNAEQLVALGVCESADDVAAPVAALSGESRITEDLGHQSREEIGHLDDAKTPLAWLEREREAGKRRGDDREEGVRWVTAEPRRIGEPWDELVQLPHGSRPAMDEEERKWVRADPWLVDEVEVDPVERHPELSERVQLRLLRPPVEAVSPALRQAPHEREARAVLPPRPGDLVGPPGARQPLPQVVQHVVVDIETVGLRLRGHDSRPEAVASDTRSPQRWPRDGGTRRPVACAIGDGSSIFALDIAGGAEAVGCTAEQEC
jgi:hypothetical protein